VTNAGLSSSRFTMSADKSIVQTETVEAVGDRAHGGEVTLDIGCSGDG